MTRVVRSTILSVLLVGVVLTLLLAPSTLDAQQSPPGEGSVGYGAAPRRVAPAREIALGPLSSEAPDATWWVVGVIAVLVAGSIVTAYVRSRS